ncbi:MAG TPA: hypothetical protein VMU47_11525 [Caldimonas sp.]|nr:hypothetical protein [Caldimonas sp.]
MNISTLSSSSTLVPVGGAAPVAAGGSAAEGNDEAGAVHGAHRHGGGHMGHAMTQALQALGLSVPSASNDGDADDAASASGAAQSATAPASGDVRRDLHNLMHALFEAVKGQQDTAGGASNGAADPSHAGSSFSSGLASLISQVSSGNAPARLQAAFTKLETDLQGTSAPAAADANAPTLQAFLTKLQDGLGYGTGASSSPAGAIVSCGA